MNTYSNSVPIKAQWKLTIIERNLFVLKWIDLLPEAQSQTLQEVSELIGDLPLPSRQRLIVSLKALLDYAAEEMQQEIKRILGDKVCPDKVVEIRQSSPEPGEDCLPSKRPIRLFVRQPFTESGGAQQAIVQKVLDLLSGFDKQPHPLKVITGLEAQSESTFRQSFENETGLNFTPRNFRFQRLRLINEADAMIVVRTSLSESGAFEVAYNIFGGRRIPMFFAVWQQAPIKTTLLRDLDELCDTTYVTFSNPEELIAPLAGFLAMVSAKANEKLESQEYMSLGRGIENLFPTPHSLFSRQL